MPRLRNGFGDESNVSLGQPRARWQVHAAMTERLGDRIPLALELREIDWLKVDRYEEGSGLYALLRQPSPQLVTRTAEIIADQNTVHPEDIL
jgi:hypothetical protein